MISRNQREGKYAGKRHRFQDTLRADYDWKARHTRASWYRRQFHRVIPLK